MQLSSWAWSSAFILFASVSVTYVCYTYRGEVSTRQGFLLLVQAKFIALPTT